MDLETIRFRTVLAPDFDLKKEGRKSILIAIVIVLMFPASALLSNIAIWLSVVGYAIWITIVIFVIVHSNKTYGKFIYNGTLTIDNVGFHIEQEDKYSISFENINKVIFKVDRCEPFSRFPTPKTYMLVIRIKDGSEFNIYTEKKAIKSKRRYRDDLPKTMELLRKKNYYLYKNIVDGDI